MKGGGKVDDWELEAERDDDYEYGYDYLYENENRPTDAAEDADEPGGAKTGGKKTRRPVWMRSEKSTVRLVKVPSLRISWKMGRPIPTRNTRFPIRKYSLK